MGKENKEKNYVYKVKCGYLRKERLLDYGFSLYKDADDIENGVKSCEKIYAIPIKLDINSEISQGLINVIKGANKQAMEETGKELVQDKLEETVTLCQLCVSTGEEWKDITKGMLFINDPSQTTYYNAKVLDSHCGEIIKVLLDNGVIYKKLAVC